MWFDSSRIQVSFAAACVALMVTGSAAAQERRDLAEVDEAVQELAAEVEKLSAQSSTNAESVQELSTRVSEISQALEELRRQQKSIPEAIKVIDDLELRLRSAEREIEALRTRVANVEAPQMRPPREGGGGASYEGGLLWGTEDGDYSLRFNTYIQPRFELFVPEDFDDIEATRFRIRRARVSFRGHVLDEDWRYKLQLELTEPEAPLLDGWVEYVISPRIAVRAGQQKVPFLRNQIASSSAIAFPERAFPVENLRYARDQGVWVLGALLGGKVTYQAGLSNGGGPNQLNDNIDFAASGRVQVAAFGERLELPYGDFERVEVPSLSVGAGAVHDLVRLPPSIAGIELGNRDVDADGTLDNVRAISSSIDALFRFRGLELTFEGMWRHERWGSILEHRANEELANLIRPQSDGDRNYLGFSTHATYFVWPRTLMVGTRLSYGEVALLGVGGRTLFSQLPEGDEAIDFDLLAQLYDDRGFRQLGFQYRLRAFDAADDVLEHLFLLEAQLRL